MAFDFERIRSILACPKCRSDLVFEDSALVCTNPSERLKYPILNDIPRLLADEAEELSAVDWSAVMRRHNRSTDTGELLQES
ncbi:MAG: hypothetical protein R3C19_11950 [Planctomycetaceae bacterium]